MDTRHWPDGPASTEDIDEDERLQERELGEWQAEKISQKESEEAATRAGDPLGSQATETEWLPISISRTRGQNATDAVESELTDLEISAIDEAELISFRVENESPDEARGPTPPPELALPKLVPWRIEQYEEYIRRKPPAKRRGRPRTHLIPPPVTGPVRRRRIRGRPEPSSPEKDDLPEIVQADPFEVWPPIRHVKARMA